MSPSNHQSSGGELCMDGAFSGAMLLVSGSVCGYKFESYIWSPVNSKLSFLCVFFNHLLRGCQRHQQPAKTKVSETILVHCAGGTERTTRNTFRIIDRSRLIFDTFEEKSTGDNVGEFSSPFAPTKTNEPRKKPWLVGLYRGLYYPVIQGL